MEISFLLLSEKINNFYRFIKIFQTGQSWDKRGQHYYFGLDIIEFYRKIQQKLKYQINIK